jgi:alpha-mannosidase
VIAVLPAILLFVVLQRFIHAHLDLAWRWPLEETRRKARRTLSTVVGLLDRHGELYFSQSTAQVFAFLEEDDHPGPHQAAAPARRA